MNVYGSMGWWMCIFVHSIILDLLIPIQGLYWFWVCFIPEELNSIDRQFDLRPCGLQWRTLDGSRVGYVV